MSSYSTTQGALDAPVMILVGSMMVRGVKEIPWDQPAEAIPAFLNERVALFDAIGVQVLWKEVTIWITALGGNPPVGYWSYTGLRIPSNPSVTGLSIYMQAISRDSGNPFNVTLSNGLEMRIE